MASEIQQWKRSSEPLTTRSQAVRCDIDKQFISRESRLRKQAVYKKSMASPTSTAECVKAELPSSLPSSSQSSPQSSPQSTSQSTSSPAHDQTISSKDTQTTLPTKQYPTLLTIPAASLTGAMTELLAASADQTLLGSHYEDVRELLWGLKGTLNKTTGGKTTHRDACSLIEMISCPNDKVKAILRAQVADQLVHRGCETRETEVCEAMAAVLAELMTLDRAFVPIIVGALYRSCPLLIPEVPSQTEETDREFEERTNRYRMSVLLYCSMCRGSADGTKPCDLRWIWYLLESINRIASKQVFLEYPGFMEPLLSCAGSELKQVYPESFGKQLSLMKSEILPRLERINGKTTEQIARLDRVLRELSA